MSKKICVAQSIEELKFILKRVDQPVICLPLNLSTQLYCIRNNMQFYNPINFINNDFYRDALLESEKLIDKLDTGEIKFQSHAKAYKAIIRFRFNSAVFLIELIEKINAQEKIDEIFISGWNKYVELWSQKNYFVSYLILNLVTNIKITKLSNDDSNQNFSKEEKKYVIRNKNLDTKKNYVLLNNAGYNFKRIILFFLQKKNYYILIPIFNNKVSLLKKKILRIFKVIFVEFNIHSTNKQKTLYIPKVTFIYKKIDLSKILDLCKNQEMGSLIKLQNRSEIIDYLFETYNIKLVITNATRGIDGYYLDKSKTKNVPSICIPHGTLSSSYNKFDKIYKNIIAESVYANNAKFFAVQSKVAKKFVESNNLNTNALDSGNLIFSKSKSTNRQKILFAVTLKDFEGIQFLGVEMYYEFLDNLDLLNKLAQRYHLDFLIKPHPSEDRCIDDLEKVFTNLKFTKKRISRVLKNVFVTISFSSTVIEDSLCSNVPVILLDRWKRYKHCKSEENVKKKNSAVYYVNNENDLVECLNTIKNSQDISFNDYIFPGSVKNNISNLINKFF